METKNQNLYLIKPNVMNCGFSSIMLQDIEKEFNIDKLELIKFDQKESKLFYKSASLAHVEKYGKEVAESISSRVSKFMSSDKMLFMLVSPKKPEHLKLSQEDFIDITRKYAEKLREEYKQDHLEYKQAANSIHSSDNIHSFKEDLTNIQLVLKKLSITNKLNVFNSKNIEKSIIDAISDVLKNEEISKSTILFLKKTQEIAKNIICNPQNKNNKIILSSFLQLIDQGINPSNNYSFEKEIIGKKLNLISGKLASDLNKNRDGERVMQLSKAYTAIINREINYKPKTKELKNDFGLV